MSKIFIINAHQNYPFSEGKLNLSFVEKATNLLKENGHSVRYTHSEKPYNIEEEVENFLWADVVFFTNAFELDGNTLEF